MPVLRDFTLQNPQVQLDKDFYERIKASKPQFKLANTLVIPPFEGRGFIVKKGQSFRIIEEEGVQIGDLIVWSATNPKEYLSATRTWTLEGWVINVFTRLWSELPSLRPMATCIDDTVVSQDAGFYHHWIGTHCATEWTEMRVGLPGLNSCHINFLQAIEPFGLKEEDIHDNLNLFQKMTLEPESGKIMATRSDSKAGDHIEFYAEMDLLAAVTVCPNGDNARYYSLPGKDVVYPLRIEVYDTGFQPKEFPSWTDWRPDWQGKWTSPDS